jgi:predicted nucleotidyltransferase
MPSFVQDKKQILALVKSHRASLQSLGVRRLGLFGSFVRGEQHAESDVDLLVEFEPDQKTFDNFMQLAFLLEDLFHRRVELVTPESISPYIKPHVSAEVEYASFTG